jgi:hypothetical protein
VTAAGSGRFSLCCHAADQGTPARREQARCKAPAAFTVRRALPNTVLLALQGLETLPMPVLSPPPTHLHSPVSAFAAT